jgi:phage major head subunit gpT-like protein|tara:strand:- start:46 stop:939 length:894 start_codon:yes stop_codon:yes gene_type:complete
MTTTTSSLSELLEPGLKAIFGDNYEQWTPEFEQVFNSMVSDRKFEEYQELTGFGQVPEKTEGSATSYDDPIQGYKTTLTNLTYSLGFKVTREMHDDDQYRKINNMPKALAMSVVDTVENMAANVLNRAFNNSYTGADGVELCSAAHPLPGGGTGSNEPSTASDLSMTSYEQALIDIAAFTSGRGKKIKVMPKKLIVSPSDMATAKRIIDSPDDPETAERSINPFNNNVEVHVNHYLTDSDAWFVRTSAEGLVCQKRVFPAEFRKDNDFDTDVAKFKTYFRIAFGWFDWRSVYGSPGQ